MAENLAIRNEYIQGLPRELLVTVPNDDNSKLAIDQIYRRLADLGKKSFTLEIGVERFECALEALSYHEKSGILTERELAALLKIAESTLIALGKNPSKQITRTLISRFHLIKSQIFRKSGRPFCSAWELATWSHFSGLKIENPSASSLYRLAIRTLHLGHVTDAIDYFEKILSMTTDARMVVRTHLNLIRAYRTVGKFDKASAMAVDCENLSELSAADRSQLRWESLCLKSNSQEALHKIHKATRPNGELYNALYLLETFLWVYAMPPNDWRSKMVSLRTLIRTKYVRAHRTGHLLSCVETIVD